MKFIVPFSLIIVCLINFNCNRKANSGQTIKIDPAQPIPELPRFLTKLNASDTLAMNTDTLLYYQKSACFGFCPTYNFTLYQNGMIKYMGFQHTEPIGTRYSLVKDAWWSAVKTELNKINFYNLADVYPTDPKMYIPDLPNTIIVVKDSGKRKAVTDNHDVPKELKEFEIYLDKKFRYIDFIKLNTDK